MNVVLKIVFYLVIFGVVVAIIAGTRGRNKDD